MPSRVRKNGAAMEEVVRLMDMPSVWYVCPREFKLPLFAWFIPPATSPAEAWEIYRRFMSQKDPRWLDRKKHVAKRFTVTITPWEKP